MTSSLDRDGLVPAVTATVQAAAVMVQVYWNRRQRGTRTTEHDDCRRLPDPGEAPCPTRVWSACESASQPTPIRRSHRSSTWAAAPAVRTRIRCLRSRVIRRRLWRPTARHPQAGHPAEAVEAPQKATADARGPFPSASDHREQSHAACEPSCGLMPGRRREGARKHIPGPSQSVTRRTERAAGRSTCTAGTIVGESGGGTRGQLPGSGGRVGRTRPPLTQ